MYRAFALFALAASTAGQAAAQQPRPAEPAPPRAAQYESAFEGYRRYEERKPAPWREANEEAGRIGGHLGILRGARPAAASESKGHAHGGRK